MAATEPIRDKKQLKQLAEYFLKRGQYRNHLMVIMGTHTALRISDLLRLTWADVYDEEQEVFRSHVTVKESKTGKIKTIALHAKIIKALRLYLPYKRSVYIFASNRKEDKAISRVQAWRIIHGAVKVLKIMGKVACHSMRKSWAYHAWTSGEVEPPVIMDILNHSNYETTRRYLGIAQDDLDRAYRGMELF